MLQINFEENKDIWNQFVDDSLCGSIFVKTCFLDALGKDYKLITCYDKTKIVAGVPIIFDKEEPINTVHPFTQYQGIILSNNENMEIHSRLSYEFKILEYFIDVLTKNYSPLVFCQHYNFSDLRPFQWLNYHQAEEGVFNIDLKYTAVLDLSKYECFEDFSKKIRELRKREYKKALKHELHIQELTDPSIMLDLVSKTYERQGLELSEDYKRLVYSITESSINKNLGYAKQIILDNEIIASNLFLIDKKSCYYLFGGNDPKYRDLAASTYLMLDMIKQAYQRNIKFVDFVGANSPNRGDYKISFNADLEKYFVVRFKK